jgi:hypothetical protein
MCLSSSWSTSKTFLRLWVGRRRDETPRLVLILCTQKRFFRFSKRFLHHTLSIKERTRSCCDTLYWSEVRTGCRSFFCSARRAMWMATCSAQFCSVRPGSARLDSSACSANEPLVFVLISFLAAGWGRRNHSDQYQPTNHITYVFMDRQWHPCDQRAV